jgi:hypothetical protein
MTIVPIVLTLKGIVTISSASHSTKANLPDDNDVNDDSNW